MAVEKKQYKLKVVEDHPPAPPPVIRLGTRQTGQTDARHRLEVPPDEVTPDLRLNPPVFESLEIRTHQPGIEALIETPVPDFTPLEQEWGNQSVQSRSIPWGWFALIALLLAAAAIWSLLGVKDAEPQARKLEVTTESILGTDEQENINAGRLIERIEKATHSFFAATKVDDLIPLVRHPERVIPLMNRYYQSKPIQATSVVRIRQLQPLTLDSHASFWVVGVLLKNGDQQDLIVEIDQYGAPRIDWETAVCEQPMDWDQFARERPSGVSMDFRVYIENDSFFSHEFADSDRWNCFRLTALNGEESLFGYTPAGSALSQQLQGLIAQSRGQRVSIIARLLVPEGLQSRRGVIIEKIVAPRWIFVDPPGAVKSTHPSSLVAL